MNQQSSRKSLFAQAIFFGIFLLFNFTTGLIIMAEITSDITSTNPYKVLGIARKATEFEIKTAYRTLVLIHHPDKGGLESNCQNLNRANEILSDPVQKLVYDTDNPPPPEPEHNRYEQQKHDRRKKNWEKKRTKRPHNARDLFSILLDNNPTVHNLTGVELSDPQKQALLLGANFIPCALMTPQKIADSIDSVKRGIQKLKDKIKWRVHFETSGEAKPEHKLHTKSSGCTEPPTSALDDQIHQYFIGVDQKLEKAIADLSSHVFNHRHALPAHIARAILAFQNDPDIVRQSAWLTKTEE